MNQYITYCAQAKLLHLIDKGGAISAKLTALPQGSFSIQMLFTNTKSDDIMLSTTPKVLTDLFTLRQLSHASVDFNYSSAEFIITRSKQ